MERNVTIDYNGKPLFQRAVFKAPYAYPAKIEDFSCFFYISAGNYEVLESHGSFQLSTKEALLKKCGNYISRFSSSDDGHQVEVIAVYFHSVIIQEVYKSLSNKFLEPQNAIINTPKKIIANELIEKYISNLSIYLDNPSLIDEDLAILKFKELVMILLKTEAYQSIQQFFSHLFNPNKLEFTTIVENNIYNHLTIEELAFLTNKSLSSFKRFFQATYQESPAKYIKRKRFERAAQLLVITNDLISDIAYQCGFQDPSTFTNSFHSFFDQSPSEYRKNQIEN